MDFKCEYIEDVYPEKLNEKINNIISDFRVKKVISVSVIKHDRGWKSFAAFIVYDKKEEPPSSILDNSVVLPNLDGS